MAGSRTVVGNPMREKFAREFLKDGNASGAARRAGYNSRAAGSQLIGLEDVQTRIRALFRSQMRRLQMEGDEVITAWTRIANFDPATVMAADGTMLPLQQWPKEARLCIKKIKLAHVPERQSVDAEGKEVTIPAHSVVVEFEWNDRMEALNCLGRHRNLFAKEAQEVGKGMSQGFAELIDRAQESGGGVQGLLLEGEARQVSEPLAAPQRRAA
jgi:phage terminase small subunit